MSMLNSSKERVAAFHSKMKLKKSEIKLKSRTEKRYCHVCDIVINDDHKLILHLMENHVPESQFCQVNTNSAPEVQDTDENDDLFNLDSDLDENMADFIQDAEISDNPNQYNNISETAVTPQSYTLHTKSKKDAKVLQKASHSDGKKASEHINQNSQLDSTVTNQQNGIFNNHSYPQYVFGNNQSFANSFIQQPAINSYFGRNQPMVHYTPMINQVSLSDFNAVQPLVDIPEFRFTAKNVIRWHNKLKKMCMAHSPMPPPLLEKIKRVRNIIFDQCHIVGINSIAEKHAVLTVYEELNSMMKNNIQL